MAFRMGLLGKKVGMTQAFNEKGIWQALSAVEVGPCVVLDVLTTKRNGYSAVKFGFGEMNERRAKKPAMGVFKQAKTAPKRFIREIRLPAAEADKFVVGQTVSIDEVFRTGDVIDVTGISKGKGFQGVMKRYHFRGFRATHGTHEYFRHGGSIGCRLTPGRVFKGQKMPGQMGNKRVTVQNLKVVEVVEDKNLLLLAGSVPGSPDCFVVIKQAAKKAGRPFVAKPKPEPQPEAPTAEPDPTPEVSEAEATDAKAPEAE